MRVEPDPPVKLPGGSLTGPDKIATGDSAAYTYTVWHRETRNAQAEFDTREEAEAFAAQDEDFVVVEEPVEEEPPAATTPKPLSVTQLNFAASVVERFARELQFEAAYEVAAEMRRIADGRALREKFDV